MEVGLAACLCASAAAFGVGARYLLRAATSPAPALGARYLMDAVKSPVTRSFYKGGFEAVMTKREAALILGLRQSATTNTEKVKEAYKRLMLANHPDGGGSPFIARKINEARDLLIRKTSNTSVF